MTSTPLIAVDAMGGDDAPHAPVAGALQAIRQGHRVALVGDVARIAAELERLGDEQTGDHGEGAEWASGIVTVAATEVVDMDEPPLAVRRKRDSSVRVCAREVKEGRAAAMVTAGNTGAAMVAAKMVIGVAKGVDRPALATVMPNPDGHSLILDVGANIDSKPSQLCEFAVMGHCYAQLALQIARPKIGLLSIGEERGKGTGVTREVFSVLESTGLNFIGNVEGGDVFRGTADVVVCDGFVGNVLLKSAEALAENVTNLLREELSRSWRTRLGYLFGRPAFAEVRQRLDYSEYGGAPLLGLKGGCFIAHGRSNPHAMYNAICRAGEFCREGLDTRVSERVASLEGLSDRHLEAAAAT